MNLKLQNVTALFKNVRTRTIIIVTALILLVGLLLGVGRLMNRTAPADSSIQLKDTPNLQSVPGGLDKSPSADYQLLQQQQNLQQAAVATKTGASAIPTLLDSSQFNQLQPNQGTNGCCPPCSCCGTNSSCESQTVQRGSVLLQPSQLRYGTLVYDTHGNVIGGLGADGKVRDKNGEIIGQVGPDGLVRAAGGSVIGSAAVSAAGDPVFDATGHLVGHVGVDGKVRDGQGRIIGTVAPDGTVRDSKGAVIGRAVNPKLTNSGTGVRVYDAQGHLLGTVGADGKVRDAKGNVIGEVGADGKVRDSKGNVIGEVGADGIVRDVSGKVIGKTGVNSVGAPVYNAQGRLLGTVGADGKVRDKGNVIGEVGADGIVRDAEGNTIGRAYVKGVINKPAIIPGMPVYDNQGKLIGTVGADRRVRDSHGKVLGALEQDGVLRDADGKVLGKVGATAPGAPIYDSQGHLVGTVGSDGIVRDSQGREIATIGAEGIARDALGNPLGSTTPPTAQTSTGNVTNTVPGNTPQAAVSLLPNAADNRNPELQAILDRQAQQISAQKAEQLQQQMQSSMSTQASQLFVAWSSPTQQYVVGTPPNSGQIALGSTTIDSSSSPAGAPPLVKAGTIMYAVLLTGVNSDEPGPVLAEIVQGKFKGARIVGTLSNQGKKVLLSFNTLTLPKLPQSIAINTVAIDESTARTALSSYTNNHYWLRYGTLFASAFIQGYGQSFLNTGSPYAGSIIIGPTPVVPPLNPKSRIFVGLGQVGVQYASALGSIFSTPPTVHVYSGTPMGILFLSDLPAIPALNK